MLLGHSFGFKLALATTPPGAPLVGVEGSGTGVRYAFELGSRPPPAEPGDINASWGPASLYPPDTFDRAASPAAPVAKPPHVQPGAGHNVSLSHAGRAYHLKALAFADECLLATARDR